MSKLLITGANGMIGHTTAVQALEQGHSVVAAVRREDAIAAILRGKTAQEHHKKGTLTFVITPDMAVGDAFIKASKDCAAIIHIASPMGNAVGDLAAQLLAGLDAVLHAAETNKTVKRVVWTGSGSGNSYVYERMFVKHPDNVALAEGKDVEPLTNETVVAVPAHDTCTGPPLQRYAYAKAAGLQYLRDYADGHPDTSFDIVALVPHHVLGPWELPQKRGDALQGSNGLLGFLFGPQANEIFKQIFNVPQDEEMSLVSSVVHLDDVAASHVQALKLPQSEKVRVYNLATQGPLGVVLDDAIKIIKKDVPELASALWDGAHMGTHKIKFNFSTSEHLLGRPFHSFEKIVIDTMKWFISLPEK